MSNHDPIAYTYEADWHCPECAIARFGEDEHGFVPENAEDNEGNSIGAVSPWDEWWNLDGECEALSCSDCHAILDNAHQAECVHNGGDEECTLPEHARI